jgi:hypothetical protein
VAREIVPFLCSSTHGENLQQKLPRYGVRAQQGSLLATKNLFIEAGPYTVDSCPIQSLKTFIFKK